MEYHCSISIRAHFMNSFWNILFSAMLWSFLLSSSLFCFVCLLLLFFLFSSGMFFELLYSKLFHLTLFFFSSLILIMPCLVSFHSLLICMIVFCSVLFYSVLLYSFLVQLCCAIFCCAVLCAVYSIVLCYVIMCSLFTCRTVCNTTTRQVAGHLWSNASIWCRAMLVSMIMIWLWGASDTIWQSSCCVTVQNSMGSRGWKEKEGAVSLNVSYIYINYDDSSLDEDPNLKSVLSAVPWRALCQINIRTRHLISNIFLEPVLWSYLKTTRYTHIDIVTLNVNGKCVRRALNRIQDSCLLMLCSMC